MTPYSALTVSTRAMIMKAVQADAEMQPERKLKVENVEPGNTTRSRGTLTATLAALPLNPGASVRFPGEDGGSSLAEMAQNDLDAALQLLANRAQYITGANGAAIALRRRGKNDMQCRASAGENVPELGALLSTEFGLSGESVRTRRALRCDDAERDPRVNREGCRQLGIASVVVMPVVNDDEVLGVFELFSGKVNAFGERDMSALQRLSEMVETAVKLARAAEIIPGGAEDAEDPVNPAAVAVGNEENSPQAEVLNSPESPLLGKDAPNGAVQAEAAAKPLFWSAAMNAASGAEAAAEPDRSHVPPGLRNLRSCEACGFPVSLGRALCVECEEKRWRGQLKRPNVLGAKVGQAKAAVSSSDRQSPDPQPSARQSSERQSSERQSIQQSERPQTLPVESVRAGVPGNDTRSAAPGVEATTGPVARLIAAAQSAATVAPAPTRPNPSAAETEVLPMILATEPGQLMNGPEEVASLGAPAAVEAASPEVENVSAGKMQEIATPDLALSTGREPSRQWLTTLYVVAVVLLVAAAVAATIFLH